MAEKRDDSKEPNDLDARKRATPPSNDAPASPQRDLKSFLPDDSFLLDLDDDLVGPAAATEGAATDEFLLVDDDLANAQKAAAADADATPPMAADQAPVEAWDDAAAVAKRAAANADAGAPDVAETEAAEPVAADASGAPSRPSLPSWITRDEGDLPSFVADEDGEDHDGAATAEATAAGGRAEPATGESVATDEQVSETEQPELAEAAAATEGTVVAMPRRRRWLAAAGVLIAAALSAAAYYELDKRGLLPFAPTGDEGAVAVAPRDPTKSSPAEAPVVAAEPAPAEPTVAEAPVEPTVEEAPVAEAPTAEPTPPVEAEPSVAEAPPSLPPEETPVATTAPTEPSVVVDAPLTRSPLGAAPRVRNELEGTETIVQLLNGHLFRGRITRVRDTKVTLRIGAGECVFDMSEITLLDSTQPEYRREKDMPEASVVLHNGQRLRGRLMKQTSEDVVLVVNNGQVVFPRSDVREVSFTGRIHF